MEPDDFVPVQATVRRSKVSAFYAMVSELNAEVEETRKGRESIEEGQLKDWRESWMIGDDSTRRAAAVIYENISPKARETLNYLLDYNARLSADEAFADGSERFPVHGHDLAKALGLGLPQLAGTLTSVAVRSRAVGRANPIRSQPHRDHGGHYWLSGDEDTFFREAREEYERERQERERFRILEDLRTYRAAYEYQIHQIDEELEELGNGELTSADAARRTKLLADRTECQVDRDAGAEQLQRMSTNPDYLPPPEWRGLFQRKEEEE